jgi:hypothetical protein
MNSSTIACAWRTVVTTQRPHDLDDQAQTTEIARARGSAKGRGTSNIREAATWRVGELGGLLAAAKSDSARLKCSAADSPLMRAGTVCTSLRHPVAAR